MKPFPAFVSAVFLLFSVIFAAAAAPGDASQDATGAQAYEAVVALTDAEKYAEAEKAAQALVAARTQKLGAEGWRRCAHACCWRKPWSSATTGRRPRPVCGSCCRC